MVQAKPVGGEARYIATGFALELEDKKFLAATVHQGQAGEGRLKQAACWDVRFSDVPESAAWFRSFEPELDIHPQ